MKTLLRSATLLFFLASLSCGQNKAVEPTVHRPSEIKCDNERAAVNGGSEGQSCINDSDCTDGKNGRCISNRGAFCTYDTCFSDGDCDNVCECEGESTFRGNRCLPGNCATDTDCPDGGFCSPSFDQCGGYLGIEAYYCHTPEDECVDDADCRGYCKFSTEVNHWICGDAHCVG